MTCFLTHGLFRIAFLNCFYLKTFIEIIYIHKIYPLTCTLERFLVCSQCCATITTIQFQNIFITPQGNSVPIRQSLPISPVLSPLKPPVCFLSIFVDLPILDNVICYINRIMCMTFCAWLLSLSIMFLESSMLLHVSVLRFFNS